MDRWYYTYFDTGGDFEVGVFLYKIIKLKFSNLSRSSIYILILFCQIIFSQESSLIFNRLNLSIFNPAYTGVEGSAINLNTRAQWIGLEDAPLTNYLIVHFPEKKMLALDYLFRMTGFLLKIKPF